MRPLFLSAALAALVLTPVVSVTAGSSAVAQEISDDEDRRRSGLSVSQRTGTELTKAINALNEEPPQVGEAISILNGLASRDLDPYDMATVLEIRGAARVQQDDYAGALQDFARIIELDTLPRDRTSQIRRNVAQLYFQNENFAQAIRFMQQFLAGAPDEATANDYFILAAAYYQNNQPQQALEPARRALALEDRKKQYYDFLNSLYVQLDMQEERGQLLETMVELFPSEEPYWSQLSGSYAVAGNDQRAFATLWAAYRAGLITEEDKIRALAQYYYQLNNPFPGARMFAREMQAGNVSRSLDNLRLLSQLWAAAREQKEAISILSEAAPKSSSGDLFYQLGQSYMADEQWQDGIDALRSALSKGGLAAREQGNSYLLIGNAYQSIDDQTATGRQRAIEAYRQAARYSSAKRQAESYIGYIQQVQKVECQQDDRERIQAVDRQKRAIDSCQGLIEVIELGGAVQVDDEQMAECRTLLAQVDSGMTAADLVDEELGPRDTAQCRGV